jgi:hypothetical protein
MDGENAGEERARFHAQVPNYNPELCHQAVRELVAVVRKWRDDLAAATTPADVQDRAEEFGADPETDRLHALSYQDAAYTHAAIGAVAPFYEGAFRHEFASLRVIWNARGRTKPNDYHRWKLDPRNFWSVGDVSDDGNLRSAPDVARSIKQLFTALDLDSEFPANFHKVVTALFTYRNSALHNGYEWPTEARTKFAQVATANQWDDWFGWSKWGDDLWICEVKDPFIDLCVQHGAAMTKAFSKIRATWAGWPVDFM